MATIFSGQVPVSTYVLPVDTNFSHTVPANFFAIGQFTIADGALITVNSTTVFRANPSLELFVTVALATGDVIGGTTGGASSVLTGVLTLYAL